MRRLLTLIAIYDFQNVQSSDYAQLLCAMGKSHEFCKWETEKWESSDNRKNFCEPFFPEFLYRNKFTNITSPTLQYIQVECGSDLKWRINGKRILQKTGFGNQKWMLNSFGEETFFDEIKKCEDALISQSADEPAVSRARRSLSQNSTEDELPTASCLDNEMFNHEPCREDPVSGAVRCDCSNFNLCAEDYIILVGNSISMVPLFFSIVILFSFP
ncbi:unnamed protein product [Oikopleura dioica]|uniref:Uncharacterized protein n=1 Tax=Oikopleura dioica TaxID=34765 RepID=E4XL40_OIKDI|nr:unnamed protein product [Oikopleura dioica]